MANMDYCKFNNTAMDVDQCLRALEDRDKTSAYECEKAEYMFTEILITMANFGIIEDFDGELLHAICEDMNEDN